MNISSIGYTLKQGIANIFRNKWFSLASVATMTACIFLFGLFYAIVTNFNYIVKAAEEGVAVTVFFEDGTSQETIDRIGEAIREQPEVSKIQFVSAQEAWETYKKKYFQGEEELAEGFADDNPLVDSANYEVYMENIEDQSQLVEYIKGLEGVRKVNQSEKAANTLSTFNVLIGYISVAIIVILLLVSVFLISNTVAIGIAVRGEEIGIMKLIGAKDGFVRGPFLIEGVMIGLAGSAVPLVLLYVIYEKAVGYVMERFSLLAGFLQFLSTREVFTTLVPVALVLGMGIGFLGSYITVKKHVRV